MNKLAKELVRIAEDVDDFNFKSDKNNPDVKYFEVKYPRDMKNICHQFNKKYMDFSKVIYELREVMEDALYDYASEKGHFNDVEYVENNLKKVLLDIDNVVGRIDGIYSMFNQMNFSLKDYPPFEMFERLGYTIGNYYNDWLTAFFRQLSKELVTSDIPATEKMGVALLNNWYKIGDLIGDMQHLIFEASRCAKGVAEELSYLWE